MKSETAFSAVLSDPILWRWSFFVRYHGRTDDVRPHDDFNEALNRAVQGWGWTATVKAYVEDRAESKQASKRILAFPWTPKNGTERTIEARAMLDSLYVQTGCLKRGHADSAALSELKGVDPHLGAGSGTLLGSAACLMAEFDVATVDAENASKLGADLLAFWNGKDPESVRVATLSCGFLVVAANSDSPFVVLVRAEQGALRQAAHFVHRLMPPMLLARLKSAVVVNRLEKEFLPSAEKMESELEKQVNRFATEQRLNTLEEAIDALAQHQMNFGRRLSEAEELLATLRINVSNIDRALEDSVFAECRPALSESLAGPFKLKTEQFTATLQYFSMTQSRADRTLAGISAMVEVRSVRWERTVVTLFGLFALFEVFHAFPELHHVALPWRAAIVVSGFAVVIAVAMLLLRRKR